MWKAYYRRQPARLFGLLVLALREQGGASWPRALAAAFLLTGRPSASPAPPATTTGSRPTSRAATACWGCPTQVDLDEVARWELRWWVVRREIGLAAGEAAGDAIAEPVRRVLRAAARARGRGRPAARPGRRGARPGRDTTIRRGRAGRAAPTGRRWRGCCATSYRSLARGRRRGRRSAASARRGAGRRPTTRPGTAAAASRA